MLCHRIVVLFLCGLVLSVHAMEVPIITRGVYDQMRYPNCDGGTATNFECATGSRRSGDENVCQCKCKIGYVTYRDPTVEYVSSEQRYKFKVGSKGCVWYSLYREGCHDLRPSDQISSGNRLFPVPIILDLTTSGSISLVKHDPFTDVGCLSVDPYVRTPGQNQWRKVDDISFELKRQNGNDYLLSWTIDSSDIYKYQGLVMKLNFTQCFQQNAEVHCIMTKVAGTYTGESACTQRTVTGRCCAFPFVYDGTVYSKCIKSQDMPKGEWCAVSLNTTVDSGNHKWREYCAASSASPTTTRIVDTTKPSSRRPPQFNTPPPRSSKITREPPTEDDSPKITSPQRSKTPRPTKSGVTTRRARPVTITVSYNTCVESSKAPPTVGARSSGGSGRKIATIVGIVLGLLLLIALLGFCLKRRKSQGSPGPKKSMSREDLAESHYSTIYGSSRYGNHLNHGYQQSIELTEDQAAAVVQRSYLRDSVEGRGSHFYDTVENGSRPSTGLSCPVYSIPEADYSLIMEQQQTKIDSAVPPMLPVVLSHPRDNPSRHLYSVLERDHDPLKYPEPTDNESVFVEANPLYCSTTARRKGDKGEESSERGGFAEANPLYGTTPGWKHDKPPPLPPRLYEDPLEIAPPKPSPTGPGEADV